VPCANSSPLAQAAQIFHGHLGGQVGAVAVPVQQVEGRRRLAHHVAFDRGLIDQVVRPQEAEGADMKVRSSTPSSATCRSIPSTKSSFTEHPTSP
jgi:hypothetical protein